MWPKENTWHDKVLLLSVSDSYCVSGSVSDLTLFISNWSLVNNLPSKVGSSTASADITLKTVLNNNTVFNNSNTVFNSIKTDSPLHHFYYRYSLSF